MLVTMTMSTKMMMVTLSKSNMLISDKMVSTINIMMVAPSRQYITMNMEDTEWEGGWSSGNWNLEAGMSDFGSSAFPSRSKTDPNLDVDILSSDNSYKMSLLGSYFGVSGVVTFPLVINVFVGKIISACGSTSGSFSATINSCGRDVARGGVSLGDLAELGVCSPSLSVSILSTSSGNFSATMSSSGRVVVREALDRLGSYSPGVGAMLSTSVIRNLSQTNKFRIFWNLEYLGFR